MAQHPLDMTPHPGDVCDDSTPFPFVDPPADTIVRSASPFGMRYLKPINGIQTKGFARSAKRRSSVLTLGSIERLQLFYANKELKLNKVGMLGFQRLDEEPEDAYMSRLPTPKMPPPSWIDLDVETDLNVLLKICFDDIQHTLEQWAMVTGPRQHPSMGSQSSASSNEEDQSTRFQVLPLLDAVTKMVGSVKNYVFQRHDLSDTASSKIRSSAIALLEALRDMEQRFRLGEDGGEYTYRMSEFGMLEKERRAIHAYLHTVEKYAFNPPHHIGSAPAVFTPEIKALMMQTAVDMFTDVPDASPMASMPSWLARSSFIGDDIGRHHALLNDNRHAVDEPATGLPNLPDPHMDEAAFLASLANGVVLCNVYNNIVRRSARPFGYITKIHTDTQRTYRATENLRFFVRACSFRFDLAFPGFDASEVARKTDSGLQMLKEIIEKFCNAVITELRENTDTK